MNRCINSCRCRLQLTLDLSRIRSQWVPWQGRWFQGLRWSCFSSYGGLNVYIYYAKDTYSNVWSALLTLSALAKSLAPSGPTSLRRRLHGKICPPAPIHPQMNLHQRPESFIYSECSRQVAYRLIPNFIFVETKRLGFSFLCQHFDQTLN